MRDLLVGDGKAVDIFKNGSKNFLQGSLNLFYRLWSVRIVNSLTNFFFRWTP